MNSLCNLYSMLPISQVDCCLFFCVVDADKGLVTLFKQYFDLVYQSKPPSQFVLLALEVYYGCILWMELKVVRSLYQGPQWHRWTYCITRTDQIPLVGIHAMSFMPCHCNWHLCFQGYCNRYSTTGN